MLPGSAVWLAAGGTAAVGLTDSAQMPEGLTPNAWGQVAKLPSAGSAGDDAVLGEEVTARR